MSANILGRVEAFLASLSTTQEEKAQIQNHLLSYLDQMSTNLHIPQATSHLYPAVSQHANNLAQFASSTNGPEGLLTAHSHTKLALHTALTQNAVTGSTTTSIQDLVRTSLPYQLGGDLGSPNGPNIPSVTVLRSTQPLFPELCSMYDLQQDQDNILGTNIVPTRRIGSNLIKNDQNLTLNGNHVATTVPNGPNTAPIPSLRFQRPGSTMAISEGNKNVVWYLTPNQIVGIDIASLIESEYTSLFNAAIAVPTSLQSDAIDLSQYNNIAVNQTGTMAVLWSTNVKIPSIYHNRDQYSLPNNPLPLIIDLPSLDTHQISIFQDEDAAGAQNGSNVNKVREQIPVLRTTATFLVTEQLTILQTLYKKQLQLINLQNQQHNQQSGTVQRQVAKLNSEISTLITASQTTGNIQDVQFHAMSPTTVLVLTQTTVGMYTLMATQYQSFSLPANTLPKKLKSTTQQATMPTLFYDLNLLPYVCTDSASESEFGENGNKKGGQNGQKSGQNGQKTLETLKQIWVKMVYIPLPTSTVVTAPGAATTTFTGADSGSGSSTQHHQNQHQHQSQNQDQNLDQPPISFTYAFLSSTGLLALISPLIPHMFWCPTDTVLQYRSWIVSKAFPHLAEQLRLQYKSKSTSKSTQAAPVPNLNASITLTPPSPLQHASTQSALGGGSILTSFSTKNTSTSSSRWVSLLVFLDQIFGLVPKSPFMQDAALGQFFALNPPEGLTDEEILSAATVDTPVTDSLITDLLHSDCLLQTPVLQLVGYVNNKFYQRLPAAEGPNGAQIDYVAMQQAESFVDCALLPLDIPVLASVSIINNHQFRLPVDKKAQDTVGGQDTGDSDDLHGFKAMRDHGQKQSAFVRLNTHYTLLSTALQGQYTTKTHLYSGFVYAPGNYFNGITSAGPQNGLSTGSSESNYHNYTLKYRNVILTTKKKDVPVGSVMTKDSFTQRLLRLAAPHISAPGSAASVVSFSAKLDQSVPVLDELDQSVFDLNQSQNAQNVQKNTTTTTTTDPVAQQMVATYISNRQFSLGHVSLQVSNMAQNLESTLNFLTELKSGQNAQNLKNSTKSLPVTASASSLPLLTTSGYLSQFQRYGEVTQGVYIDTSFLYLHLPDPMIGLSSFRSLLANCLSAATETLGSGRNTTPASTTPTPTPTHNPHNSSTFGPTSTSTPAAPTPAPKKRRKLGLNFVLTEEDAVNVAPVPKPSVAADDSSSIGLSSSQPGAQKKPSNGSSGVLSSSSPQGATKSTTATATSPYQSSYYLSPTEQQANDLLSVFGDSGDKKGATRATTLLSKQKIDVISDFLFELVVNLRQKQIQEALISTAIQPIQHYLYPTVAQSYLPGLQIAPLPQHLPMDPDDPDSLHPDGEHDGAFSAHFSDRIGVKHVALAISSSVQTHSMSYYLTPKLLSITLNRILDRFISLGLVHPPALNEKGQRLNPFFDKHSVPFDLTLATLTFFLLGVTNSTIYSNMINYHNTVDNTKMAQIQRVLMGSSTTGSGSMGSVGSKIQSAIKSSVQNLAQANTAEGSNPTNFALNAIKSASPSTNMSSVSTTTQLNRQGSLSYVDTISGNPFGVDQGLNPNDSVVSHPQNHLPVSPYHLPFSLLYCYASIIPPVESGSVSGDGKAVKLNQIVLANYLSTSLFNHINNAGGQTAAIPMTLSLSTMYMGTVDAMFSQDFVLGQGTANKSNSGAGITSGTGPAQNNPFAIHYPQNDKAAKYYPPISASRSSINFNNFGTPLDLFDPLCGQFKPVKQFSIFLTRQIMPNYDAKLVQNLSKTAPQKPQDTTSTPSPSSISQFKLYPFPLPRPVYALYSDLLLDAVTKSRSQDTATSGKNGTNPAIAVPSILSHPSTLELAQKYPQHDLNAVLDSTMGDLQDEYLDVIVAFEQLAHTYVTPNTQSIATATGRQNLIPTSPHITIKASVTSTPTKNTPSHAHSSSHPSLSKSATVNTNTNTTTPTKTDSKPDSNIKVAYGSATDVIETTTISSISDFITRYSSTMGSTTPVQSLQIRIDQEAVVAKNAQSNTKTVNSNATVPKGITISPTNDSFIHEISDRILVIHRDCFEVKVHLGVSLTIMTEIAGSTHDFVEFLLQSFTILESNLDAMIDKYNYLATRQELLQKKLKLVNEKLGAVLFAQQDQNDPSKVKQPESLDLINADHDPENQDGVGKEIQLIPQMNKNPAQIHQQLTLLQSHVDQMDREMAQFKADQEDLMVKQCQMFGIGVKVDQVTRVENDQNVHNAATQFQPVRQDFQSLLGDIVSMYNTLLSYRVRIQAAQNELEEKS